MATEETWYIVKQVSEECKIVSSQELEASAQQTEPNASEAADSADSSEDGPAENDSDLLMQWGPFETQNQAIAKRIGLIRAGKCQPAS